MNRPAKVQSIEVVRDFRIAYAKLAEEVQRSLDLRQIQIRKFLDWLNTDQRNYWLAELKQRRRDLEEAKTALRRKQLQPSNRQGNHASSEQAAVRKAKESVELAEQKLKALQHWSKVVEQAVRNYEASYRQMASHLTSKVPNGLQMLDGVLQSLEAYLRTQAPPGSPRVDNDSPGDHGQ